MPPLTIQTLEPDTLAKLACRAQLHGISIEEEAGRLIKQSLGKPLKLGELALEIFGETNGIELESSAYPPHEPISFAK